jgi:hypothetical protein
VSASEAASVEPLLLPVPLLLPLLPLLLLDPPSPPVLVPLSLELQARPRAAALNAAASTITVFLM